MYNIPIQDEKIFNNFLDKMPPKKVKFKLNIVYDELSPYNIYHFLYTFKGRTSLDDIAFTENNFFKETLYINDAVSFARKLIALGYIRHFNLKDLSNFTNAELKEILKKYNLKISGKKEELIKRLIACDENIKKDIEKLYPGYIISEKGREFRQENEDLLYIYREGIDALIDLHEYYKYKEQGLSPVMSLLKCFIRQRGLLDIYDDSYEEIFEEICDIFFNSSCFESKIIITNIIIKTIHLNTSGVYLRNDFIELELLIKEKYLEFSKENEYVVYADIFEKLRYIIVTIIDGYRVLFYYIKYLNFLEDVDYKGIIEKEFSNRLPIDFSDEKFVLFILEDAATVNMEEYLEEYKMQEKASSLMIKYKNVLKKRLGSKYEKIIDSSFVQFEKNFDMYIELENRSLTLYGKIDEEEIDRLGWLIDNDYISFYDAIDIMGDSRRIIAQIEKDFADKKKY